jgi:hypothetical protein
VKHNASVAVDHGEGTVLRNQAGDDGIAGLEVAVPKQRTQRLQLGIEDCQLCRRLLPVRDLDQS